MKTVVLSLVAFVMTLSTALCAGEPEPVKIWDEARHNAFTDIIRFNDKFYCAFREGFAHVPGKITSQGDGGIRVLVSADGERWTSAALLKKQGFDLRDAKLSVTPDKRLMVLMGGSIYINGKLTGRMAHVAFSDKNGSEFSAPTPVHIAPTAASEFDWIWRVTWHNDIGYGVIYQPSTVHGKDWNLILVRTTNGVDYAYVCQLKVADHPNEATIRFTPGTDEMNILVRRESADREAMFGKAEPPYTLWTWQRIGVSLGGPNFVFLPDGSIFAGGRVDGKTALGVLDFQRQFKLWQILPSAGDNSYPGFCLHDNIMYVTYYSTHIDNKTSIFLVKFPLDQLQQALNSIK